MFLPLAASLTGCATSAHQLAPRDTPPAPHLGLAGEPAGALQVTLQTVIVYRGPGSWKARAYWDEYVLNLATFGPDPVTLRSATLIDDAGRKFSPGDDWAKLEERSAGPWARHATGQNVAVGAGKATFGTAGGLACLALCAGPLAGPVAGVAAGSALVSFAGLRAIEQADASGEKAVNSEFARRRLPVPHDLPPGSAAERSLFFPITPAPTRLLLTYSVGADSYETSVDLTPVRAMPRPTP